MITDKMLERAIKRVVPITCIRILELAWTIRHKLMKCLQFSTPLGGVDSRRRFLQSSGMTGIPL
jgi:hypothetical protein